MLPDPRSAPPRILSPFRDPRSGSSSGCLDLSATGSVAISDAIHPLQTDSGIDITPKSWAILSVTQKGQESRLDRLFSYPLAREGI
jgi:hypothetical protein